MKKYFLFMFIICSAIVMIQSCKKDDTNPGPATDPDRALYNEILAGGYTYYQNGNLLTPASASAHGSFKLRFNATAQAALDSTGELPAGNTFPTGSVLVKEVFSGSSVSVYAVMKKDPANANAGSGWVWAELNADGSTYFSARNKGSGCISCHSTAPHRDLVRTFDFH